MTRPLSLLTALATAAAIGVALLLALPEPASHEPAVGPSTTSSVTSSTGSDGERDTGGATASATDLEALDAGGLRPGLVDALARARADAREVGVSLPVNSGYRSAEEQAALLEDEVAERGDPEEARRWVFPPERSMHVRGLAVDINNGPGADWLDTNGHRHGLCRTLAWEWWHFEWRQRWEDEQRCPDPARDLREAPTR